MKPLMMLLISVLAIGVGLPGQAIAGGSPSAPPSVCMVSYYTQRAPQSYSWHTCSGTLITPQIVVTASHCFQDGPDDIVGGVRVSCGLLDQSRYGGRFSFLEEFSAAKVRVSSTWNNDLGSDFAFIKLDHPTARIRPMKLPVSLQRFRQDFMRPGVVNPSDLMLKPTIECRYSGFGYDEAKKENYFISSDMSPKNGLNAYQSAYDGHAGRLVVNAWGPGIKPTRFGDSGGPLYCRTSPSSDWLLIALVSTKLISLTRSADTGTNIMATTCSGEFLKFFEAVRNE